MEAITHQKHFSTWLAIVCRMQKRILTDDLQLEDYMKMDNIQMANYCSLRCILVINSNTRSKKFFWFDMVWKSCCTEMHLNDVLMYFPSLVLISRSPSNIGLLWIFGPLDNIGNIYTSSDFLISDSLSFRGYHVPSPFAKFLSYSTGRI